MPDKPAKKKRAAKKKAAAKATDAAKAPTPAPTPAPASAPASAPTPPGAPTGIRIRALLRIHQGGRWIEKGQTVHLERGTAARHVAKGRAEYVTNNPTGEKTDD
jgi:hypothetical protein